MLHAFSNGHRIFYMMMLLEKGPLHFSTISPTSKAALFAKMARMQIPGSFSTERDTAPAPPINKIVPGASLGTQAV